jgi:hypothetical protein
MMNVIFKIKVPGWYIYTGEKIKFKVANDRSAVHRHWITT